MGIRETFHVIGMTHDQTVEFADFEKGKHMGANIEVAKDLLSNFAAVEFLFDRFFFSIQAIILQLSLFVLLVVWLGCVARTVSGIAAFRFLGCGCH